MQAKTNLVVLDVDRPLKDFENAVRDIFNPYTGKAHVVLFFHEINDKTCIAEIVLLDISPSLDISGNLTELFPSASIEESKEEGTVEFIISDIGKQVIFDVLDQRFNIEVKSFSKESVDRI